MKGERVFPSPPSLIFSEFLKPDKAMEGPNNGPISCVPPESLYLLPSIIATQVPMSYTFSRRWPGVFLGCGRCVLSPLSG